MVTFHSTHDSEHPITYRLILGNRSPNVAFLGMNVLCRVYWFPADALLQPLLVLGAVAAGVSSGVLFEC